MENKISSFFTFIDQWIPASILQSQNEKQQARSRFIVAVLFFCAGTSGLSAFVMLCMSLLSLGILWLGSAGAAAVCIVLLAVLAWFRRAGKLILISNIFSGILFFSIALSILVTGGWTSPVSILLLSVPVFIFPIVGIRSGLLWSFVIFSFYLLVFYLHHNQVNLIQFAHEESREAITTIMWCVSIGMIIGCLALYSYVIDDLTSALREERERFRREAMFDPLTGVYNRDSFQKKIAEAIEITRMSGGRFALLRFDIRNLKIINTQIDYVSGDELVKKVASSVQVAINRDNDNNKYMLARFGSGEFAVLMQDIKDRGEVISVASRIRKALAEPVEISSDMKVQVQSSIGGVLAPDFSVDVRFLMRGAQDAMIECAEREEDFILR